MAVSTNRKAWAGLLVTRENTAPLLGFLNSLKIQGIAIMQTQPQNPTIIINGIQIHAELNTSAATGLLGLFQNAPLLAIINHSNAAVPPECVSRLQSDIQTTADFLGDTLTAMGFAVMDENEHITPYILATYAAMMGELLPFLTRLSENLNYCPKIYPNP